MRYYKKTKTFVLALAFSLVAVVFPHGASAATYRVVVDGAAVSGAQAEMVGGQLAVAIRPVMEAMGARVSWNDKASQVTMDTPQTSLAVWIGTRTAFQDGVRLQAPLAPYMENGKTMGPAWWLVARFNARVSFDGTTLTVNTRAPRSAAPGVPFMNPNYYFPFAQGSRYEQYFDGWGDPRSFDGKSSRHEGTDILAAKGTPIIAVASGTIVRYGWNTLGGYRLNVELDDHPGYRFYYAHMDRYAPTMALGVHVKAGQIIGYVGSTGEGPERTEGNFVPHLHFGIYGPDWKAIDGYQSLKYWENHKVRF
jgi:murein DD-endopeptidase MepM/ murein hydrolase activator NlpD